MVDIICAICGKNQQISVLYSPTFRKKDFSLEVYSARRLPDRIHYRIVKCKRCGLIFSSPILPLKELAKFYRESLCNYDEQIPYLKKTYMGIFNRARNNLSKNPKVLEVGCGNGFFLEELTERGINSVFGVEPSPKMVSQADVKIRKNIKVDIFKKGQFKKKSFDLICCFHTLDHMIKPNEFILESYNLLKKGGYITVVVHDTGGLSVKLFGEKSPIFDIEHVYLFNKKTLRAIFEKNGFEVIDVFDVVNNYPISYWLRMSGLPIVLKSAFGKIVTYIKPLNFDVSLAGGNIAILAKKKE